MDQQTLGQRLRELRDKADLSLRELAGRVEISAPFLSDIELGRRMPSDEVALRLAKELKIDPLELRKYDNRELKRAIDSNPALGFAFRTAAEQFKEGKITPEEIVALLTRQRKESKR